MPSIDENEPLFVISVAAELATMHPQTLRQYDRLGLVVPQRTRGKSRRYSLRDVAMLREIQRLSGEGITLEGIRRIVALDNEVTALRERVRELESALAEEMLQRPGRRVFAAGGGGEVVSFSGFPRMRHRAEVVVWSPYSHRAVIPVNEVARDDESALLIDDPGAES